MLTTSEVAALVKVDKSTVYRMAEAGRLPAVKVGRQWRFPEDRLIDWLDRHTAGPAAPGPEGPARLIAPDAARALAELMGDLLGVMVVITDMRGRPLAEVANPCGLFTAAHRYPGVLERCISGWREMAEEADLEPRWQPTPLGFLCARALVRAGDRLSGMVLAGGVAPQSWPPPPEGARRLAEGLGVPAESLQGHLDEVYRLSAPEQERVLRLLPRLAALVSALSADQAARRPPDGSSPSDYSAQRSDQ